MSYSATYVPSVDDIFDAGIAEDREDDDSQVCMLFPIYQ
jgi:hypothetical protein